MIWLTDPKTNKPSVTLSMFVYGFVIVTLKLLFSGVTIGHFIVAPFSGIEYGASLAALGGVYTLRKRDTIRKDVDKGDSSNEIK